MYVVGELLGTCRARSTAGSDRGIEFLRFQNPTPPLAHHHSEMRTSQTLLLPFVPRALITVAIGKGVDTETVDLVCKVLPRIPITIPAEVFVDGK